MLVTAAAAASPQPAAASSPARGPASTAAAPIDGYYGEEAADARRPPSIRFEVRGGRLKLWGVAGTRCLRDAAGLSRWLTIRGGRFRVSIRLVPRRAPAKWRDRFVMEGRWTSPYSVSGRLRAVVGRARVRGRRLYCDSGWRKWRAAAYKGFGARTSVPTEFVVPGTVTTTVTVYNDGDYDSRKTELTILPGRLGKPSPARLAPVITTSQGSCRWPTTATWADWSDLDFGSAILCDLGRVRAGTSVAIAITESWSLDHCVYSEGEGSVESSWDAWVRSPLQQSDLPPNWHQYPGLGSMGQCPSLIPEE